MSPKQKTSGFTLIELLAVVAIIAILATLALVGVANASRRARDAKRQRDMASIKEAVELYNQDKGEYPAALDDLVPDYIRSVPQDPKNTQTLAGVGPFGYTYERDSSGANFVLFDWLEYKKTPTTLTATCSNLSSAGSLGNGVAAEGNNKRCFRVSND